MPDIDPHLEKEYDNRGRVPEHPALIARWNHDSQAYRAETKNNGTALFDLAYGPDPRQQLDLFGPDLTGEGTSPLLVFIHGGYWRALDRTPFSHMAKGPNAHGVSVCRRTQLEQSRCAKLDQLGSGRFALQHQ